MADAVAIRVIRVSAALNQGLLKEIDMGTCANIDPTHYMLSAVPNAEIHLRLFGSVLATIR